MKQNKGITLVALIITIIVLLILAGVAISAVNGDGIISKAKLARKNYQDAQDEENLTLAGYQATLDSINNEGNGGGQNPTTGEVPDELKKYILGTDLQGRVFWNDSDGIPGQGLYEDGEFVDPTNVLSGEEAKYAGCAYNGEEVYYIEYKGIIYKFATKEGEDYTETSATYGVQKVGSKIASTSTTTIEVGSKISYDGRTWTVMYVNGNEIQMISNDALQYNENSLYLGYNDTYLTGKSTLQGTTNLEKAIYSYNNAITTLNSACLSVVKGNNELPSYITDVRCVGSNPSSKNSESTSKFSSTFLANCPSNNVGAYNGVGKDTDNNYETDYEILVQLGETISDNEESYWLASRFVDAASGEVNFSIRIVFDDGYCGGYGLWYVRESNADGDYDDRSLRPVVSLNSALCSFTYDSSNSCFTISAK